MNKKIEINDTVYYENDFGIMVKAKVVQLLTSKEHTGKPYTVALVVATMGKTVKYSVIAITHLTTDATIYKKQLKRQEIKDQINQLQEELKTL